MSSPSPLHRSGRGLRHSGEAGMSSGDSTRFVLQTEPACLCISSCVRYHRHKARSAM